MTRRSKRHLEVFPTCDGQWAWQVVASDGTAKAIAPDPYTSLAVAKLAAKDMAALISGCDPQVQVLDQPPMPDA